jgi:hypothetical protein
VVHNVVVKIRAKKFHVAKLIFCSYYSQNRDQKLFLQAYIFCGKIVAMFVY